MEKRHYQSGYYIDWKKNAKNTAAVNESASDIVRINAKSIDQSQFSASTNEEIILSETKIAASSNQSPEKTSTEVKEYKNSDTKISIKDKIKAAKTINKLMKSAKHSDADDIPTEVLFILAIFLPPIAVGLVTDWDLEETLICLGLTFLCVLPGIVYAVIKVSQARP
jgi:uncharacterized membrane protein YqaE (UPF0057 family)